MGAEQSSISENVAKNSIGFFINGKEYIVDNRLDNINPTTKLVDFIRNHAGLKGTKYTCREGGCGACVVMVQSKDPVSGADITRAVNSCLIPVLCCDGFNIKTIEGLGCKRHGYNRIQQQMVKFSGTQCGYCSPGMVMNMYSLMEGKRAVKSVDVEDSFDGNICRCTGYRPILDAMKSLTVDASEELKRKCPEVKDCCSGQCCQEAETNGSNGIPQDYESIWKPSQVFMKLGSGEEFIKPVSLQSLFEAIYQYKNAGIPYRLVAGNTGTGIYKNDGPYQGYIDVNSVAELQEMTISTQQVVFGATVTLTKLIESLKQASELGGYSYTEQMHKHIKRVANTPVRNAATWAGNLMLKHNHNEFPSDIFLLFETVGAKINIGMDMNGNVILSIILPPHRRNYYFKSYKITRRYQNAHAYVNAGFAMEVDPNRNFSVRDKPNIVFGGISPEFVHASATEVFFVGKFLDSRCLKNALERLQSEIQPDSMPQDASPEYRKSLTQSLLYKFILSIMGSKVGERNRSGAEEIERNLHYGKQHYHSDKSNWPVGKPIPKLEAKYQVSGEAEYINDIHPILGELFGAFVLSTQGNASIKSIDESQAMMMPGVVKFIQAKDIPGINNYMIFSPASEEIFAASKVKFSGQPIGMIIAKDQECATAAAKKVNVVYDNIRPPVLDIKSIVDLAEKEGKCDELLFDVRKSPEVDEVLDEPAHVIKGEFRSGAQCHFPMETQICICIPKEDGLKVYAATQWTDLCQAAVSAATGIPIHGIDVEVRRLGGAFGCKITRGTIVSSACAVAASLLNKPVRVQLDLETHMQMIGRRLPYYAKYEAGTDKDGKIISLQARVYCDPGYSANEATSLFAILSMQSCYKATGWLVRPGQAVTNTAANTYCRAPGSTQGVAIMETILEHVANVLQLDPIEVRKRNFIQNGDSIIAIPGLKFQGENPLGTMIQEMKIDADYQDRKRFIDNFNRRNRWKKRGIAMVPMRYPVHFIDYKHPVYIAVYHADGTVAVSHSGIEMGQGINTKVAQAVAYELGIPLNKILVKPCDTLITPNSTLTGGATTSELTAYSALNAAKQLKERIRPIREKMQDATWEKVVDACFNANIQLTAYYQEEKHALGSYDVWGLNCTEVEIDVLTGEYKIVRVDVLEDAGESLSPEVDIGQIEGSVIMGLGLWLTEKIVYDKNTGEMLTKNTWEYKPPLPKDIPEDFRVTMRKNMKNAPGFMNSKATGEPPLCMSVCVLFALREAIDSARREVGSTNWFQMDGPVTLEDIHRLALANKDYFNI